ncbi:Sulfite oxidase [Fusarium oxysporum f. sp. albedinis]|nr:Sulfite oxidase [Fusarium oxysporum f. sp. albedinis]
MSSTCGITLSIYYLVDSYAQLSNDDMSTIMLVRHTMSFGMGYRYGRMCLSLLSLRFIYCNWSTEDEPVVEIKSLTSPH